VAAASLRLVLVAVASAWLVCGCFFGEVGFGWFFVAAASARFFLVAGASRAWFWCPRLMVVDCCLCEVQNLFFTSYFMPC